MVVPSSIKRRFQELDDQSKVIMDLVYTDNTQKEGFVNAVCFSLSNWYINQCLSSWIQNNYTTEPNFIHKQLEKHKTIFLYLFRGRISEYWDNNKSSR